MGPLHFNASSGAYEVVLNPNRWTLNSTMVFIESPAGTGFSYALEPAGYVYNDTTAATENLQTMIAVLEAYPEYQSNELFLAGESYAGVYVPMLAEAVLNHNSGGGSPKLNIKGIMVGNGCTGTEFGACSDADGGRIDMQFLAWNSLISQNMSAYVQAECAAGWTTAKCNKAQNDAYNTVGPIFIYDILEPCEGFFGDASAPTAVRSTAVRSTAVRSTAAEEEGDQWMAPMGSEAKRLHFGEGPQECLFPNDSTTDYLNRDDVRVALHVPDRNTTGPWRVCGQIPNHLQYTPTMTNEPALVYPSLLGRIRVLIYSGTADLCVPHNGDEEWTSQVGLTIGGGVQAPWQPWFAEDQVAGYVTQYVNNFQFATVTGAGHMVPQFRPLQAYYLFLRFVNNQPIASR
jgi:serine carboxypeptidase-like clade I